MAGELHNNSTFKALVGAGLSLVTGFMIFLSSTVWSIHTIQTTLVTRLRAIDDSIQDLRAQGTDDRYRGRDAARDFMLRDQRIMDISERLKRIEQDHNIIKNGKVEIK